jgi:hypothetical protein
MTVEERKIREDLVQHVTDHNKHYWALVNWMKRKKMTANDLTHLFAEGHTVAHEIWRLFDVEGGVPNVFKSERRATLTACLEQVESERKARAGECDYDLGGMDACERIATRLKVLLPDGGELEK